MFSVFFTFLQQIGAWKNGLKAAYSLIFLFLALRYDFGNDYMFYFNDFLELKSLQDYTLYFRKNEFGWLYFNFFFKYLFGDVGFHVMLASMAALFCIVFYRFTIKYIPPNYYTFAISLLLLEPNIILVLSSGMRQSIAVLIFIFSFDYLAERKYVHYLAGILISSFFHGSALVFSALILMNIVKWRIHLPYIFILFFGLFYLKNNLFWIFDQVNLFLEIQESDYLVYTKQGFEEIKFGLGFGFSIFLYLVVLVVNSRIKHTAEQDLILKMTLLAIFVLILSLSVPLANRLNFYIFPLLVSSFAITISKLATSKIYTTLLVSRLSIFIIISFFTYQHFLFWQSEVYSPYFIKYKTIFQSPLMK
jgi:hypothetical protein